MAYTHFVYQDRIRAILSPAERRIFAKLTTGRKIQDYLDTVPINFEMSGETYMSPRRVLASKTAHCFEGALLAAAALAYHGQKPLLMDFQTLPVDEDHVITLFKENGRWGAISKTNHAVLRYRDPVYANPRELAMSYFHEYFLWSGKKSLLAYSAPIDLSRYSLERWVTSPDELDWLVDAVDSAKHFPVAPKKNLRRLRDASKIELQHLGHVEWKEPKAFKRRG
jgi:hypothetical protein